MACNPDVYVLIFSFSLLTLMEHVKDRGGGGGEMLHESKTMTLKINVDLTSSVYAFPINLEKIPLSRVTMTVSFTTHSPLNTNNAPPYFHTHQLGGL